MLGLSRIQLIIVGGLLAAVLTAGAIAWIYKRGADAEAARVRAAVSAETIRALDAARISKEKTDEDVRRLPYGDRADGLR